MTEDFTIRISDPNGEHDTVYVGPIRGPRQRAEGLAATIETATGSDAYVEPMYSPDEVQQAIRRHLTGTNKRCCYHADASYVNPGVGFVIARITEGERGYHEVSKPNSNQPVGFLTAADAIAAAAAMNEPLGYTEAERLDIRVSSMAASPMALRP